MPQNEKLYPPILEGTLPAFYGTELSVPFIMNKAVGLNEVDGFAIKIKTAQSNSYIGYSEYYGVINTNQIVFSLGTDLVKSLTPGQYYKVQMAYISGDTVGYYSDIAIVKYTTTPEVFIENLEENIVNPHIYTYMGVYTQGDGDISEKVYSYRFNVYANNVLFKTTDWLLHNNILNEKKNESCDLFYLNEDLDFEKNYSIEYQVKTNNGLEVSSKTYLIKQKTLIEEDYGIEVLPELNYENGYIRIKFNSSAPATGSFIISRADESSNFKQWHDIYKLNLKEDLVCNFSFKDFDVAHNTTYKYAISQINEYNLRTEKKISMPITALFEDMFLFDGVKQLKIRFNPKVSSFKNYILESKVDTIGSQYPHFFRNGQVKYKEFPLNGLISHLSDEENLFLNINTLASDLTESNISDERIFKLEVLEWLSNGQSKLFKSPVEGNYIVHLMNVSLSPADALGRMLHSFSCNAYEVADYTSESLKDQGILQIQEYSPNLLTFNTINFSQNEILLPKPSIILCLDGMTPGTKIKIDDIEIIIDETGTYSLKTLVQPIKTIKVISGKLNNNSQITYGYYKDNKSRFDSVIAIESSDNSKEFDGEIDIYAELNKEDNISVSFINSGFFSIKENAISENYEDYNIEFNKDPKIIINLKDLVSQSYKINNLKITGLKIGKEIKAKIDYYEHTLVFN